MQALCLLLTATPPALAQTRPPDEAGIRKSVAAYETAVNQRDGRAIARVFSRDADAVYFDSPRFVGRDSLANAQIETISKWPSTRRFSLTVTHIRFFGSDLALVETLARFSEGEMTSNRGTIVMARHDGKWLWEALRVYPAQRAEGREP
jgi:uncharacterized protein (TIGR02246 family)